MNREITGLIFEILYKLFKKYEAIIFGKIFCFSQLLRFRALRCYYNFV